MLYLFILVLNIILCFIFILSYLEYQRRSLNRQFDHIPGPGQYPVIGNLLGFTCSTNLTDLNCYVDELSKASIVKLIVPGHMILGISDPQILQEILNSSEFLGRVKYFLKFTPWKEAMLTAACPTMWRSLRKAIQPAFSHKNLVSIIPTFNMHLHKFKERINEYADSGKAFDFFSLSDEIGMKQALDTILNITEVDSNLMHDMFKKIVDYTCERLVRIDQHPDFIYHRTQKYLECHKIFIKLKKIFDEALTRTLNEQNNNCKKNVLYYLLKKGKSDNQKELSTVQIMDNALIMFGAGYETSAITISHIILMLAMHPEVDQKLFLELRQNYKIGDPVDHKLIKKLPYLDMVFKETLRLFPTVPIILRQAVEQKYIAGIGMIPKGTIIIPNIYQLHRSTLIWGENADKFDPENFLPENVAKRHTSSYLPFSTGPRNCIGTEHAQLNIKLALIHILNDFRFETDLKMNELDVRFSIFIRLNNNYFVRAYKRSIKERKE